MKGSEFECTEHAETALSQLKGMNGRMKLIGLFQGKSSAEIAFSDRRED
jgi:hypothetical protein